MAEMIPAVYARPQRNWALWVGACLVLAALLIALFGPLFAPQDPLKENYVAQLDGRYIRPPFPPGVEAYPLGSDEFGRDLLSRLLWAVRPTLMLAVVVAAVRLLLGLAIGLLSGWPAGRGSRWLVGALEALISAALAIPLLFVALCIIAALASRWGVWAFILGLSLTGWAETARVVQSQARAIRAQPFIESAWALGGTSGQVAFSHLIPHLLPLIWIQLAFEVSAALLTAAALGFLGYFMNAVWIPIEDWTGLRASGMPELGQMLGASVQNQPWTAASAGTLVFLIVLAFTLLGEGLRYQFSPEHRRKTIEPAGGFNLAGSWLEEHLYLAVTEWQRTAAAGGALTVLLAVMLGGGWLLWQSQNNTIAAPAVPVPGGQMWAAELHDAQGTSWSAARGPAEPALLWTYQAPEGFTGGPVIDRSGNLYLSGSGGKVYSLAADGTARGFLQLAADPVGWQAISVDGTIIVADVEAGLSAFDPQGGLLWHYQSDPPDEGRSSPVTGADGTIYYAVKSFLVAVSPQGERAWQIRLPTYSFTSPLPRLSPDSSLLFFEDFVIDAQTGKTLFRETPQLMDRYLVGADGKIYYRTSEMFMEWQPTEKGAVMIPRAKIDTQALVGSYRIPYDSGVSPSHQPWLLYTSGFEYTRMAWLGANGQSMQVADFPYRQGRLIGIDAAGVGYMCGAKGARSPVECRAVQLSSGVALWKADIASEQAVVGGAITEGRLYVATADGKLFALGH